MCDFAARAGNDRLEGLLRTPHLHPVETLLAGLEGVTQARRGWQFLDPARTTPRYCLPALELFILSPCVFYSAQRGVQWQGIV